MAYKTIPNFDGFEVNEHGIIRSVSRKIIRKNGVEYTHKGKVKKLSLSTVGYLYCIVKIQGTQKHLASHRAVALAFIPNPDNLPNVNHKDGNRLNNHVSNLEWCTQHTNIWHSITELQNYTKGSSHPNAKLSDTQVIKIKRSFDTKSIRQLAKEYGVNYMTIRDIKVGKTWSHIHV